MEENVKEKQIKGMNGWADENCAKGESGGS